MTAATMRSQRSLTIPLSFSLVLHAAAVLALMQLNASKHAALPRTYRVSLVAAPAGPRELGVVNAPKPALDKAPPPKARSKAPAPAAKTAPAKKTTQATATVAKQPKPADRTSPQPKAGGGPTGGKGADAATVKIDSDFEFPYQTYLDNIVNQIAKNFYSGRQAPRAQLSAVVTFLIHRDGHVSGIRLSEASTSYEFNLEAKGAVEAVGKIRGFGPLPDGFADEVLPVVFSFDPRIIR